MNKAFSNLLKYIDKLPYTKKEQVYQWVKRYVDPTSSAGGRLINELRETRFKEGLNAHIIHQNTLFGSESTMVVNGIVAKVAEKLLLIQQILSFTAPERAMNGLPLLIVCSKDIPFENRLKSWGLLWLHFLMENTLQKAYIISKTSTVFILG